MSYIKQEIVGEAWVNHVAENPEVDLRAHQIALTYSHFARAVDDYIFGSDSVWRHIDERRTIRWCNVSWFAFATWATVSINRDIRNQRPPLRAERVLPVSARPWLSPTIMNIKTADGQRISRALSWGQRLVFVSTTKAMLALMARGDDDCVFTTDASSSGDWAAEVGRLAEWDGKAHDLQVDRHLKTIAGGIECYRLARQAAQQLAQHAAGSAEAVRLQIVVARRILMANILITAVEQDVVHRAVTTVVEHVPQWLADTVSARASRLVKRWRGTPRELAALDLPLRLLPSRTVVTALWARAMTEQILVMMLPTETLRLGRDIPPLHPSTFYFPPDLRDLGTPPSADARVELAGGLDPDRALAALAAGEAKETNQLNNLVKSFDRTGSDGIGSGAGDWRRYDERMNWAITLMRTRQQDHTLLWPPYSAEDTGLMLEDKFPQRVGDPSNFDIVAPLDTQPYDRE